MSDKPVTLTPEQVESLRLVVENLACYALVGWEEAMEDDRPEELKEWKDRVDESLKVLGSKRDYEGWRYIVG